MNEMGRMVEAWLAAEGYAPELQDHPETHWVLVARMPNGWTHTILQPRDKEEVVVVQSAFAFSEPERRFLATLPPPRKVELLWEMRMTLLFRPTEFDMMPLEDGFPLGFQFHRELSYDGLTRNQFMEGLREVHKCCLYASWAVARERELREAPAAQEVRVSTSESDGVRATLTQRRDERPP